MSKNKSSVEYREIQGWPGYRVGNDGFVWSRWIKQVRPRRMGETWWKMKSIFASRGYLVVKLSKIDGSSQVLIHRLVLEAFVGPCPDGMECRHLDGDRTNNALSNLRWGTPTENQYDRIRHGTSCQGSQHPMAKLDEAKIEEIRRLRAEGILLRKIGDKFGVHKSTVQNACIRKTWKHI